jgi:hypothetical protein
MPDGPIPDAAADAEFAATVARAQALAAGMTEEDRERARELQRCLIAVGLPGAQACFIALVNESPGSDDDKAAALAALAAYAEIPEVVCPQVAYTAEGAEHLAYVVIRPCGADHNIVREFDRIRRYVPDEQWVKLMYTLNRVVQQTRMLYAAIFAALIDHVRTVWDRAPDDPCTEFASLHVDRNNQTLYAAPTLRGRAGVFVRLENEPY